MKVINLVIACLLGLGLSWGSGYFNYILCLHPGQDLEQAHIEKRDLADVSSSDLHIDLFQEDLTLTKTLKVKATIPVHFRSGLEGIFLKAPSPKVSSFHTPEFVNRIRTVRIIR